MAKIFFPFSVLSITGTGLIVSNTSPTIITPNISNGVSITGTMTVGISISGTCTTGISIGATSGAAIHFGAGTATTTEGDFWYDASAHVFKYRDNVGVKTISAT